MDRNREAEGHPAEKKLRKKKGLDFFLFEKKKSRNSFWGSPSFSSVMGKLRHTNGSGKQGQRKEVNVSRNRSAPPSEPSTKKSKIVEVVENESHLAAPSKSGLDAIIHPFTAESFVKQYWEPSRPLLVHRPYDTLWNAKLVPEASSKSRLTSALSSASSPAYYHTDVQIIGYSESEDDLIFETPADGVVDMDFVWQTLSAASGAEAPALHVLNMDLFSKELSTLLGNIDKQWRGDGAAVGKLTVAGPGCAPFGPHFDGQAQFILQIRGKQLLESMQHPEGPNSFVEAAGDEHSFPCFVHGPAPEVVFSAEFVGSYTATAPSITLEAGSTLFLPPGVKFSRSASSKGLSVWLTVYLPPMPQWKPSLEQILSLAAATSANVIDDGESPDLRMVSTLSTENADEVSETNYDPEGDNEEEEEDEEYGEVGENEAWTLFPHKLVSQEAVVNPGERMKETMVELFQRAAQLAPQYIDSLLINSGYSRSDFLSSVPAVHAKIGGEGLDALLGRVGLVKIRNFLPDSTAEALHKLITHLPESDWAEAYAAEDAKENNIDHAFRSARNFPMDHAVFGLFKRILPQYFSDFSLGRYSESHFIAPHDDRAYKEINGVPYSRHIALIFYCSKDWKEEYGGQLVDMVTETEYVPEFNSMIAFEVPRFHQVKPVLAPLLARYSVFGWFFKPGINYELWTGEQEEEKPKKK